MSEPTETPQADNKVVEFEVYNPTLEPFTGPLIFTNREDAERIAAIMESKSGLGFFVREAILNERPIPKWSIVPTPVTVEEGRMLAAKHGQDRMVIIAWNALTKAINVVTVGSNPEHSNAALSLSQFVMKALGYDIKELIEDRRAEHETVPPAPADPATTAPA